MSRGVHTGTPPELETQISIYLILKLPKLVSHSGWPGPRMRAGPVGVDHTPGAALTVVLTDLISSSEREGSHQALSPLQTRLSVADTRAWDTQRICGRAGSGHSATCARNCGAPTLSRAAAQQAPLGKLLDVTNNHILKVTFYLKAASPHSQWRWVPRPGLPPSLLAGRPASSGCCQDFPFSSTSSPKFFHFGDVILRSRVHCFCFLPHPVAGRPLGLCPLSLSHRGGPGAGDAAPAWVGSAVAPLLSHPRAGAQTRLGAVLRPGSSMDGHPTPRGQCSRSPPPPAPGLGSGHCPPRLATSEHISTCPW